MLRAVRAPAGPGPGPGSCEAVTTPEPLKHAEGGGESGGGGGFSELMLAFEAAAAEAEERHDGADLLQQILGAEEVRLSPSFGGLTDQPNTHTQMPVALPEPKVRCAPSAESDASDDVEIKVVVSPCDAGPNPRPSPGPGTSDDVNLDVRKDATGFLHVRSDTDDSFVTDGLDDGFDGSDSDAGSDGNADSPASFIGRYLGLVSTKVEVHRRRDTVEVHRRTDTVEVHRSTDTVEVHRRTDSFQELKESFYAEESSHRRKNRLQPKEVSGAAGGVLEPVAEPDIPTVAFPPQDGPNEHGHDDDGDSTSPGSPTIDIDIDACLEKERRSAQTAQFAALRVQRHIQERIYVLRQRRRIQLGQLDVLSEAATERSDNDAPSLLSLGLSSWSAVDVRSESLSRPKTIVKPRPDNSIIMRGWLLKRQRRHADLHPAPDADARANKWDWRCFELRGTLLTWRKREAVLGFGLGLGLGLGLGSEIQRKARGGSGLGLGWGLGLLGIGLGLGSLSFGSSWHDVTEEERDVGGEISPGPEEVDKQDSGPALHCPPPEVLRLIIEEERIKELASRHDSQHHKATASGGLSSTDPLTSEDSMGDGNADASPNPERAAENSGCNARPRRGDFFGGASHLDLSGLVVILPDGHYPVLPHSRAWPRYHIQLFEEPEHWYDGWTSEQRPVLELWAPCYEEYLSWNRALDRATMR